MPRSIKERVASKLFKFVFGRIDPDDPDSDSDSDTNSDADVSHEDIVDYDHEISTLVADIIRKNSNLQIKELLNFIVTNSVKSGTKELCEALSQVAKVVDKDSKDDKQTGFDRLAQFCLGNKVFGYGVAIDSEFYKKLKPKIYCLLGDQSLIKNDAKTALGHYDTALKLNPNSTELQLAKYIALSQADQDQKALDGLEKISKSDDVNFTIPAKIAAAKIYIKLAKKDQKDQKQQSDHYNKAYEYIKTAKKTLASLADIDYRNLYYILNEKYCSYILNLKIATGIKILDEALTKIANMVNVTSIHKKNVDKILENKLLEFSESEKHDYYQGCWLLSHKKYEKAIIYFDKGIKNAFFRRHRIFPSFYNKNHYKNQYYVVCIVAKADALYHLNRYEDALIELDKLLTYDPNNQKAKDFVAEICKSLTAERRANFLSSLDCSSFLRRHRLLQPKSNIAQVDSKNDQKETRVPAKTLTATVSLNLKKSLYSADAHFMADHNQEAVACYDVVLNIDPNNTDALLGKGSALVKLNRNEQAILCFDSLLKIKPHADAFYIKGWALEKLKRYEEAVVCFDAALNIDPHSKDALNHNSEANALYNKAAALCSLKRYEEVIACLDAVLKINPNHGLALYLKGVVLVKLDRGGQAVPYFKAVLKLESTNDFLYEKASVLIFCKRYEEAIKFLDAQLKTTPNDFSVLFRKGTALIYLRRYQEAIICFDAGLRIEPNERNAVASWYELAYNNMMKQDGSKKLDGQTPLHDSKDSKHSFASVITTDAATVTASGDNATQTKLLPDPKPAPTFAQQISELEQLKIQSQELLAQQEIDDQTSMQGSYDQNDSKYGPAPVDAAGNIHSTATAAATAVVTVGGNDSKEITPIVIEPIPTDDPRLIPRAYNPTPELLKSQQEKLQAQVDAINIRLEWLRANVKKGKEENRLALQKMEKEMQPILKEYDERQKELAEQRYILDSDSEAIKKFYNCLQGALNSFFVALHGRASGKLGSSSTVSSAIDAGGSVLSPLTGSLSGAGAAIINFGRNRSSYKEAVLLTTTHQFSALTRTEPMVERLARYLTLRYEDQIRQLSVSNKYPKWFLTRNGNESWWDYLTASLNLGGAQILAGCVAKRIGHAILAEREKGKLVGSINDWIIAVFTSTERHALISGDRLDLEERENGSVTVNELLSGSGIKVPQSDGSFIYYANPKQPTKDNTHGCYAHRIGFRMGTKEEVDHLKFAPVATTKKKVVMAVSSPIPTPDAKAIPLNVLVSVHSKTQQSSAEQKGLTDLPLSRLQTTAANHDAQLAMQAGKLKAIQKQNEDLKNEMATLQAQIATLQKMHMAASPVSPVTPVSTTLASAANVSGLVGAPAVKSPVFSQSLAATNTIGAQDNLSLAAQLQDEPKKRSLERGSLVLS